MEKEENVNENVKENIDNVEVIVDNQEAIMQHQIDELEDRHKRLLAEFENYKKRSSKERENLYNMITGDVMLKVLPVMDNLDKAASAKSEDEGYKEGVTMVVKQFSTVLEGFGLKEIESVGKKFDPELHEAVGHVEDRSKSEQEIVEEFRKGYQIGNKVIRHALVVVAN